MSEAELHLLRGRMRQGLLNKVARGEVFMVPPVGYVRSPDGGFDFDPDEQARTVVRMVFDQFDRLGTIRKVLRYLLANDIRIGIRPHAGRIAASSSGAPQPGIPSPTSSITRSTPATTASGGGKPTRAAGSRGGGDRGGSWSRPRSTWP